MWGCCRCGELPVGRVRFGEEAFRQLKGAPAVRKMSTFGKSVAGYPPHVLSGYSAYVRVSVTVCVRTCVRACVCTCMRAGVGVCVRVGVRVRACVSHTQYYQL